MKRTPEGWSRFMSETADILHFMGNFRQWQNVNDVFGRRKAGEAEKSVTPG
jgi:hypothetical protein